MTSIWCTVMNLFIISSSANYSIFVSDVGFDDDVCGSITSPCGTLYHASSLIVTLDESRIMVNGQSTSQIRDYIANRTYNSHPCLPQTFEYSSVTITFNDTSIQNMSDWYPPICTAYDHQNSDGTMGRRYMFEATKSHLTINNLRINDIDDSISFGIIGVQNEYDTWDLDDSEESSLVCNHCVFTNIRHSYPDGSLIYSTRYLTLYHCIFANIRAGNDLIVMTHQAMKLSKIIVTNSIFNGSLIHIQTPPTNREESASDTPNKINLDECQFTNIETQIAVIYDQFFYAEATITDVSFTDIHRGSIYRTYYASQSTVHISNVYISTSQTSMATSCTLDSLFELRFAGEVRMENITAEYQYNLDAHCYASSNTSDGIIGADQYITYSKVTCAPPIGLIRNLGPDFMINNMELSINITEDEIALFREAFDDDYVSLLYDELRDSHYQENALILNYGNLTMHSVTVNGAPFGFQMIFNYDVLSITQFNIVWDKYGSFDPNALQSSNVIAQSGTRPNATIIDSHLYGGGAWAQILLYGGVLKVQSSIFEGATTAVMAKYGEAITISKCGFLHLGRYWTTIDRTTSNDSDTQDAMLLFQELQQSAMIEYSDFEGFQDNAFTVFIAIDSSPGPITLRNNLFIVNDIDFYYDDVAAYGMIKYGMLLFQYNDKVSIYNNNFYFNDAKPETPWLFLAINGENGEPSCLSANNFSNYAFWLYDNSITSCFRPYLHLCLHHDQNCSHGHYGSMNADLFDETSYINIDASFDLPYFFLIENPWDVDHNLVHAMDNLHVNIIADHANESDAWQWTVERPDYLRLLILDSIFLEPLTIWHSPDCKIEQYDRLTNASQYIAHFKMLCSGDASWGNYTKVNTSVIQYVDHLSPTQLHFTSTSLTYFPGQKLKFEYQIFDKLGSHCYDYIHKEDDDSQLVVKLESNALKLSQEIDIQEDGGCDTCDTGVILIGLMLKALLDNDTNHTFGTIQIDTSILNGNLMLTDDTIALHVTSCPVGYGSDSNDLQCLVCPDGTYNLSPNNTDDCKSCHQDKNKGLLCSAGEIKVLSGYWLGFVGVNDSMITNICPFAYCCHATEEDPYCTYDDIDNTTEALCATNRDVSIPLCGACMEGYTEAINSPQCILCDEQHLEWWLKPILLAVAYTLFLVFSNRLPPDPDEVPDGDRLEVIHASSRTLHRAEFVFVCQSLVLRVLLYYQQALGCIMWPSSSSPYMAPIYTVASLFNLETTFADSDAEPQCLLKGLTSKGKILFELVPWFMIVILLFLTLTFEVATRAKCSIINTNFGKAFLAFSIICAGGILSVLFKLLNCQFIGTTYYHFYFGVEECSETWTFYTSLFVLFVLVVFWGAMFYALYRCVTPKQRENPDFVMSSFCKYYKPECYYWEFVVLIRRSLISLYSILYTWKGFSSFLVAVLLVFLALHEKYQPFKRDVVNRAEYYALCGVIVVITMQTTTNWFGTADVATVAVYALFICVPIFAFFVYAVYIWIYIRVPTTPRHESTPTVENQEFQFEGRDIVTPQIPHRKIVEIAGSQDGGTPDEPQIAVKTTVSELEIPRYKKPQSSGSVTLNTATREELDGLLDTASFHSINELSEDIGNNDRKKDVSQLQ